MVYLLGGEAALSAAIQAQVRDLGYDAVRLAGPSRVETLVAVAREVLRTDGVAFDFTVDCAVPAAS